MNKSRGNRVIFLLFLMFLYILAQLGWWAFLITHLTAEVYVNDPRLQHRVLMVWGEGAVFALLLLIGFIFTYKSYLKELRLARQQRNFLLSVTHEFKTPIASLRLQLETFRKRNMTEEQKQLLLENALHDTDRLNALAENILAATRIDQQSFNIDRQNGNLTVFLRDELRHLTQTVGRDHQVEIDSQEEIHFAFDPNAMRSVVSNLFENAVKYSPKQSCIRVGLHRAGEKKIVLTFSDQGSGIHVRDREKIFEKFFRLGNEDTRSAKGTGLGLYIVKHFVQLHNGTIRAETANGGGTEMIAEFRL